MNDILWSNQQMSRRKLANQFLAKISNTSAKRILITSVQRGDGKTKFMTALAAELARVGKEFVPLSFQHLEQVNPDSFRDELVIVYGPAYRDTEGLHTLPEKWMRSFDAVVILVMLRKTKQKELKSLVSWVQEYGVSHVWPIVNQYRIPSLSQLWMRFKVKLGLYKPPEVSPAVPQLFKEAVLAPPKSYQALPPSKDATSEGKKVDASGMAGSVGTAKSVSVSSVSKARAAADQSKGATLIGTMSPVASRRGTPSDMSEAAVEEPDHTQTKPGRGVELRNATVIDRGQRYPLNSKATLISSRPPAPHIPSNNNGDIRRTQSVIVKPAGKKSGAPASPRKVVSGISENGRYRETVVNVHDDVGKARETRRSLVPPPSANGVPEKKRGGDPSAHRQDNGEPRVVSKPIVSARATIISSVPPPGPSSKKDSKTSPGGSNGESS